MRGIDAVRAVNDQLAWAESLDILRDLLYPSARHVHVAPDGAVELVARLVGENSGVLCVSEPGVGVLVRHVDADVVLEVVDDLAVREELVDEGRGVVLRNVNAAPAEEVESAPVVVVLR